jgi:hypothetical protein
MNEDNLSETDPYHLALNELGRLLMHQVRDPSIIQNDKLIRGELRSALAMRMSPALDSLSMDADVAHNLILIVVDTVIAHLLNMIDQEETLDIIVTRPPHQPIILKPEEGLLGQMYGEEGWIRKFSNESDPEDILD